MHFALSNANAWRIIDGDFNYEQFYAGCVDYFEIIQGPAANACIVDLLSWWNRCAFISVTF